MEVDPPDSVAGGESSGGVITVPGVRCASLEDGIDACSSSMTDVKRCSQSLSR